MDTGRNELRHRLAQRQQEKAQMERQLHAAQRRYQKEVAPLQERVLRLKMERLREAAQRNMRSARHRNAYHDAQRAYETFQEEREVPEIVATDELKRRYREASKRCHPDVVPETYRAEAAATFQALESAYESGDVRSVRAIADALERWGFPTAQGTSSDRDAVPLRTAISRLESAIAALRDQEAYQVLTDVEDVDALVKKWKRQLMRDLRAMK